MLIVPNAIAMNAIVSSSAPSAIPATISPPSITIPWIALVWLIGGVCRVVGTPEITASRHDQHEDRQLYDRIHEASLPGGERFRALRRS